MRLDCRYWSFWILLNGSLVAIAPWDNVSHVCLWVRNPVFSNAVTDGGIDTLDENLAQSGLVVDVCDFAGL